MNGWRGGPMKTFSLAEYALEVGQHAHRDFAANAVHARNRLITQKQARH